MQSELNRSPELNRDRNPDREFQLTDQDNYLKLLELAEQQGWDKVIKRIQPLGVVINGTSAYPKITTDHSRAWFRAKILRDSVAITSASEMHLQPIFTEGLRPTGNAPVFVRVYNGRGGLVPGLHAIKEIESELELHYYTLPDSFNLPRTNEEVATTATSNRTPEFPDKHRATLDTLHQHQSTCHYTGNIVTANEFLELMFSD